MFTEFKYINKAKNNILNFLIFKKLFLYKKNLIINKVQNHCDSLRKKIYIYMYKVSVLENTLLERK